MIKIDFLEALRGIMDHVLCKKLSHNIGVKIEENIMDPFLDIYYGYEIKDNILNELK